MEIVVFTNGCFDLLHPGHIDLLKKARALGTKLIVGINSDESVRALKGKERPFLSQEARAAILKELRSVDEVYVFEENTPERLIREIQPDILVKGGDWAVSEIVGADFVLQRGGKVFSIPFVNDFSSSKIVEKIKSKTSTGNDILSTGEGKSATEESRIKDSLKSRIRMFENLSSWEIPKISKCADLIYKTLAGGNQVSFCGDEASAGVSRYLTAVFGRRFQTVMQNLPASSLKTHAPASNAQSEADNFESNFSGQIETPAKKNDLLVAITTGENAPSVISAVMKAREMGGRTIALTGINGKKIASLCDANISMPVEQVSRMQEAFIAMGHLWCEMVDEKIKSSSEK
jgi:D-glycero-beta-D-manno-heptose 1-phosphate adenylyltransferase